MKTAKKICDYYSTTDKVIIPVEYSDASIKKQTKVAPKPAHYIFGID
jgi:hypothetical protein